MSNTRYIPAGEQDTHWTAISLPCPSAQPTWRWQPCPTSTKSITTSTAGTHPFHNQKPTDRWWWQPQAAVPTWMNSPADEAQRPDDTHHQGDMPLQPDGSSSQCLIPSRENLPHNDIPGYWRSTSTSRWRSLDTSRTWTCRTAGSTGPRWGEESAHPATYISGTTRTSTTSSEDTSSYTTSDTIHQPTSPPKCESFTYPGCLRDPSWYSQPYPTYRPTCQHQPQQPAQLNSSRRCNLARSTPWHTRGASSVVFQPHHSPLRYLTTSWVSTFTSRQFLSAQQSTTPRVHQYPPERVSSAPGNMGDDHPRKHDTACTRTPALRPAPDHPNGIGNRHRWCITVEVLVASTFTTGQKLSTRTLCNRQSRPYHHLRAPAGIPAHSHKPHEVSQTITHLRPPTARRTSRCIPCRYTTGDIARNHDDGHEDRHSGWRLLPRSLWATTSSISVWHRSWLPGRQAILLVQWESCMGKSGKAVQSRRSLWKVWLVTMYFSKGFPGIFGKSQDCPAISDSARQIPVYSVL